MKKSKWLIYGIALAIVTTAGCSQRFNSLVKPMVWPRESNVAAQGETQRVAHTHPQWHTSADSAFTEASRTGKPILANFTGSDWCIYCKKLESEVFAKPEFGQWADQQVVLLEVDFPRNTPVSPEQKQHNENLKARYQQHIQGFPTVLMLAPDGSVIGKLGYQAGGPSAWLSAANQQLEIR